METNLLKHIPNFSSTSFWISPKGAIGALVIGVTVAGGLITLGCIPSVPLWNIITIISLISLSVLTWLLITQIYLRTGKGTKIGLAYDGFSIERKDWNRTRDTLRDLFNNGKIGNQVCLRFVPVRTTKIDQCAKNYMKRYGLTILVGIQESPQINKKNPKHDQHPFFPEICVRLTKKVEKQFVETNLKHTIQIIMQRTKTIKTLSNVVEARAHNLHDMMLLLIAALCYREGKYEDCAAISRYLEQSLSLIMRPDQEPRNRIRLLAMESYLRPAEVPILNLPPYDKLMEIRNFAETALDYFQDSYLVPLSLARIRFLTGDTDGAIELTDQYKAKIEKLQNAGREITDRALVVCFLNSGFLEFIQGHWVNAYNDYCDMLAVDEYRNENWEGIIEFIDYVETLDRYEGICYLQTLYRLIADQSVPAELRAAAQNWVNQDDSREELRTLISHNYPSLAKKSEERVGTREQQRKTKQRSKRKNKGRKKKRR